MMWSPWGRSSPRVRGASPKPTYPCSSFKDVHRLYSDDDPASPRRSFATAAVSRPQPETENPNPNPHRHPAPSFSTRKKVFHRVHVASSLLRNWPPRPEQPDPVARIAVPGAETRIVVYYTSLRVVRPTFEACRAVQSILEGFRVKVDERDVAMDSGFLDEVQCILGVTREKLALPAVFLGGRYVGGAEEVRQMYETGELKKLVEALPAAEPSVCYTCGGFRFLPCRECNGSHKVHSDKVGFGSCTACNENGLIKCPACYPTALIPR